VVAAPVRTHDPRHEVSQGSSDEGRLVHEVELDLFGTVGRPARESVRERALLVGQDADPVPPALVQQGVHLRPPIHRDHDERRAERDGHERVRGHAVDLIEVLRGDHGDPRGEHPERPAERRGRVLPGLPGDLQLVGIGGVLGERLTDPGRREPAVHREIELEGRGLRRGTLGHAQLQGYGEWLTGWSRPSANREKRKGSSNPWGSPSSSFATSCPTPIIL
jgi:hypothetical protein